MAILVLGAAVSVGYYLITNGKSGIDDEVHEGVIRIEVLNGCGETGVARRARDYLRDKGYDVLSIGDASEHFPSTIVVERKSASSINARMVARTLKLNENQVTQSLDSLSPVSVTLIIGDDYFNYLPDSMEVQ